MAIALQAGESISTVKLNSITALFSTKRLRTDSPRAPGGSLNIPPIKDSKGFCEFKLMYEIVDRSNPTLPGTAWARCVSIDQIIPSQP